MSGEYPKSTWYGANSNNYSAANRPGSQPINKIVIHVTQGSWSSAINWFKDPRAGVSAHYTVRSSDGFIGQSLREKDISVTTLATGTTTRPASASSTRGISLIPPGLPTRCIARRPNFRRIWSTSTRYRWTAGTSSGTSRSRTPPTPTRAATWDWNKYMNYVRSYANPRYSQIVDNTTAGRFYAPGELAVQLLERAAVRQELRLFGAEGGLGVRAVQAPDTGDRQLHGLRPVAGELRLQQLYPGRDQDHLGRQVGPGEPAQKRRPVVHFGHFPAAGPETGTRFSSPRWTNTKGYVVADAVRVVKAA